MSIADTWVDSHVPPLDRHVAIVTGANSGLGYETSRQLVRRGAKVILACRDAQKGQLALNALLKLNPQHTPEVWTLDLASLASIHQFARRASAELRQLHLLINNAGVMAIPKQTTADGFEMQLGTNHLGHFALTARLLPLLQQAEEGRIINVSSGFHHMGKINFEDLQSEQHYSRWGAYAQSKLANLLFTQELARKLKAQQSALICAAAHPGYASTHLQFVAAEMRQSQGEKLVMRLANALLAQPASMGALPTVFAATQAEVFSGGYYGPKKLWELRGLPGNATPSRAARDLELGHRLWQISENLTQVHYSTLDQMAQA